jgi:hypothetical protein
VKLLENLALSELKHANSLDAGKPIFKPESRNKQVQLVFKMLCRASTDRFIPARQFIVLNDFLDTNTLNHLEHGNRSLFRVHYAMRPSFYFSLTLWTRIAVIEAWTTNNETVAETSIELPHRIAYECREEVTVTIVIRHL